MSFRPKTQSLLLLILLLPGPECRDDNESACVRAPTSTAWVLTWVYFAGAKMKRVAGKSQRMTSGRSMSSSAPGAEAHEKEGILQTVSRGGGGQGLMRRSSRARKVLRKVRCAD